jgi:hypothetical protein
MKSRAEFAGECAAVSISQAGAYTSGNPLAQTTGREGYLGPKT